MLFCDFSFKVLFPLTHFSTYHFAAAVVPLTVFIDFQKLNGKLSNIIIIKSPKSWCLC